MIRLILIMWILVCFYVSAKTYYIDSFSGNDLNSGTSENEAWSNIAKLNSIEFQPGDVILFKKGGLWREQFDLRTSDIGGQSIVIGSYGEGEKPVISGADIIKEFTIYSDNIWLADLTARPGQIFINNIRGTKRDSLHQLTGMNEWYYDTGEKKLYLYNDNPASSVIEAAVRKYGINLTGFEIEIEGFHFEKVTNSAIKISPESWNIIIGSSEFYQWSVNIDGENSAIFIEGSNVEIKDCFFGRSTGNDIADQNWAGHEGIRVKGTNVNIHGNNFYHNSTENESQYGLYAHGIYVEHFSGTVRIYENYMYHVGSHGVRISGYSSMGDSIFIYNNSFEYCGQAGVNAFKTRAADGIGGTGYIFNNHVSFANRLGGDIGAGTSQACGIHLNDGIRANTEPDKPFIKWYIYENTVHDNQAHADSSSEDSGGIIADFNAHGAEIFRNLVYNNWGKGISVWNANNCKIYYNIVYGNDAGIVITAANGTDETADNHKVYNNTVYKNFNGYDKGSNLNSEMYFGKNGHNTIIQNNIFYASDAGYACFYDTTNSTGIFLDHNLIYKDTPDSVCVDTRYYYQTYEKWRSNHPEWEINGIYSDPRISIFPEVGIMKESPAINGGFDLGEGMDFRKNPIIGNPDIGAVEYVIPTSVSRNTPDEFKLSQNYPNPFNPVTIIEFSVSGTEAHRSVFVQLRVYDILGKEVAVLVNEEKEPGIYKVKFDASLITSGVYFYKLTADNYSETRKMILLR